MRSRLCSAMRRRASGVAGDRFEEMDFRIHRRIAEHAQEVRRRSFPCGRTARSDPGGRRARNAARPAAPARPHRARSGRCARGTCRPCRRARCRLRETRRPARRRAGARRRVAITTASESVLPRRWKIVPARAASQPTNGQRAISLLATKLTGRWLCISSMSSHEMWLATYSTAPGSGSPKRRMRKPKRRTSAPDHQRIMNFSSVESPTRMRAATGFSTSSASGAGDQHVQQQQRRAQRIAQRAPAILRSGLDRGVDGAIHRERQW